MTAGTTWKRKDKLALAWQAPNRDTGYPSSLVPPRWEDSDSVLSSGRPGQRAGECVSASACLGTTSGVVRSSPRALTKVLANRQAATAHSVEPRRTAEMFLADCPSRYQEVANPHKEAISMATLRQRSDVLTAIDSLKDEIVEAVSELVQVRSVKPGISGRRLRGGDRRRDEGESLPRRQVPRAGPRTRPVGGGRETSEPSGRLEGRWGGPVTSVQRSH